MLQLSYFLAVIKHLTKTAWKEGIVHCVGESEAEGHRQEAERKECTLFGAVGLGPHPMEWRRPHLDGSSHHQLT